MGESVQPSAMVTMCAACALARKSSALASRGSTCDDRFLFEDEIGEEIAELRALVLDGLVGVERRADAGRDRRAADGALAGGERFGGAPGEDERIEAERRLLGRELVLDVLRGERDQRARDGDFVDAVLGERDADGVADAVGQQRADADGALDPAILAVARLGDAEVERVIPVGPELEQPRGEEPVGVDHHLGVARLHRENEIVVAVLAGDARELDRALDHAGGRVAEAVHDAVGKRAVVGADAHGDAALLADIDQRLEGLVDAGEFLLVLVVGVFADGEFLFVGEVAGVDADLLDPLRGFQGGVGLEVDVGDDGHVATRRRAARP